MVVTKVRYQQGASKEILSGLRQLGFTDYEARIYVQLLKVSPATAYEISKGAGVPHANAYAALEALAQRGAVLPVNEEPLRYIAASPKSLFESIARQTRSLCSDLATELSALTPADQDSYVWTAHGGMAVQDRIEAMIAESRRSIWIKAADNVIRYTRRRCRRRPRAASRSWSCCSARMPASSGSIRIAGSISTRATAPAWAPPTICSRSRLTTRRC